jgi:hypothetical protein
VLDDLCSVCTCSDSALMHSLVAAQILIEQMLPGCFSWHYWYAIVLNALDCDRHVVASEGETRAIASSCRGKFYRSPSES